MISILAQVSLLIAILQIRFHLRLDLLYRFLTILLQERLLGYTLGSALTGFIVFEQRKLIHDSVSDPKSQSIDQAQVIFSLFVTIVTNP
jgi:hypothetical protein